MPTQSSPVREDYYSMTLEEHSRRSPKIDSSLLEREGDAVEQGDVLQSGVLEQ